MDKTTARHIWHDLLQNSIDPFHWGINLLTVETLPDGTSFRVNTDYIVGLVKITEELQDCFTVTVKPDNYGGSLIYEHVTADNLVSQIDRVIREGIIVDNRESHGNKVAA